LGTGTLSGGSATFTTSALAVGAHTITAAYGGDANFLPSTSAALTQTVTAPTPPPVPTQFDFGTAASPVAAGYTQVTAATAYSAAQHYGWLSGVIFDKDYPTATDPLTRDFNYTSNGTFAVDVANGTYAVTVTMGSAGYAKVNMGVFLQGT